MESTVSLVTTWWTEFTFVQVKACSRCKAVAYCTQVARIWFDQHSLVLHSCQRYPCLSNHQCPLCNFWINILLFTAAWAIINVTFESGSPGFRLESAQVELPPSCGGRVEGQGKGVGCHKTGGFRCRLRKCKLQDFYSDQERGASDGRAASCCGARWWGPCSKWALNWSFWCNMNHIIW